MREEILRLEYVSKSCNANKVLQNICMNIYHGEIVKLVGEYRGGIALLEILGGKTLPDYGSIYINCAEEVLNSPKVSQKKGIGIVRWRNIPLSCATVMEYLFLDVMHLKNVILGNEKSNRVKCAEIISLLGLNATPDTFLVDIETDKIQALELGRAILKNPKIIIIDLMQILLHHTQIMFYKKIFSELSNRKIAVLILSNDIDLFTDISERIYIMSGGCIVGNIKTEMFDRQRILQAIASNASI